MRFEILVHKIKPLMQPALENHNNCLIIIGQISIQDQDQLVQSARSVEIWWEIFRLIEHFLINKTTFHISSLDTNWTDI